MHLKLLQKSVLLSFSLPVIIALPRPDTDIVDAQSDATRLYTVGEVDDWVSSGNYLVYSCGSAASNITTLLDFAYLFLQTAILSTNTPPYKAFFRSASPAQMTSVLTALTTGSNVTSTKYGPRRPTLVCVNPSDTGLINVYDLCKLPSSRPIYHDPDKPVVFLCPKFLTLPLSPSPTEDCGVVNEASTAFADNHDRVAATQYGHLVSGLADMYIWETLRMTRADVWDFRSENVCLMLPPGVAMRNPSSYAHYVSSECMLSPPLLLHKSQQLTNAIPSFPLTKDVRARCTSFPTRVPVGNPRLLLASDEDSGNNATNVSTANCTTSSNNSTDLNFCSL